MTTPSYDRIRERVNAATPGPWAWDEEGFMGAGSVWCASEQDSLFGGPIAEPSGDCYPRGGYAPKEDMTFIAHAREDVPTLLDALDRVRQVLDDYTGEAPVILIANIREALDGPA